MNFYESVSRYYEELSHRLPPSIDREGCESCVNAGEPEFAITELLELAFVDGSLTFEILKDVEEKMFDSPSVLRMVNALRELMTQNSVA